MGLATEAPGHRVQKRLFERIRRFICRVESFEPADGNCCHRQPRRVATAQRWFPPRVISHNFQAPAPAPESQRDSTTQLRVASLRATLGLAKKGRTTLKGLCHDANLLEQKDATPLGLKIILPRRPRVVAGGANPGLDDAIPLGLSEARAGLRLLAGLWVCSFWRVPTSSLFPLRLQHKPPTQHFFFVSLCDSVPLWQTFQTKLPIFGNAEAIRLPARLRIPSGLQRRRHGRLHFPQEIRFLGRIGPAKGGEGKIDDQLPRHPRLEPDGNRHAAIVRPIVDTPAMAILPRILDAIDHEGRERFSAFGHMQV
jgi:hypothetical protein